MSDQASSHEGEEEYLKDFEVIRAVSNTETFSPRSENTAKSFENNLARREQYEMFQNG